MSRRETGHRRDFLEGDVSEKHEGPQSLGRQVELVESWAHKSKLR